jgi:hypothetical protein
VLTEALNVIRRGTIREEDNENLFVHSLQWAAMLQLEDSVQSRNIVAVLFAGLVVLHLFTEMLLDFVVDLTPLQHNVCVFSRLDKRLHRLASPEGAAKSGVALAFPCLGSGLGV